MQTRIPRFCWHVPPVCVVSFFVLLGCRSHEHRTWHDTYEQNLLLLSGQFRAPPVDVAPEIADRIPARLASLKPGMTLQQTLTALGLPPHPGAVGSSGPPGSYGFFIQVQTNRGVDLRFDLLKEPPALVKAELFGDGWGDLRK